MDGIIHLRANFVPAEKGTADYEVTAALLVSELVSGVSAGENSGRLLKHDLAGHRLLAAAVGKMILSTNQRTRK